MTTKSVSLETLESLIAKPEILPILADGRHGTITHPTQPPVPFIAPPITRGEGQPHASIALVSASAAVGKSYLAKHLAATTGNPLWDLSGSGIQVGTHFFSGTIVRSYGGRGFVDFESGVRNREVTLIVDALDEALVKAGLANYKEALDDLIRLVSSTLEGERFAVVLFGRQEALDFAAILLSEGNIPWQRFNIDFYAEPEAARFIQTVASSRSKKISAVDIDSFISLVFGLVSDAIGDGLARQDDPNVRSFLGYAPVLDALGRLASEGNAYAKMQNLHSAQQEMAVWSLLSQVMREILEREQEKITGVDAKESDASTYARVYSPHEQIKLLLSESANLSLNFAQGLSADERERVRERVTYQLRDHPFRSVSNLVGGSNPLLHFANVALRDFAVAWALCSRSVKLQERVLDFIYDERFRPSPLLIRLVLALAPESRLNSLALGALCDSAGTRLGSRNLELVIEADGSRDEPLKVNVRENDQPLGSLLVEGGRLTLRFNRMLSRTTVYAKNRAVVLGSGRHDFQLGPEVVIVCRSVFAGAESIRVPAGGATRIDAGDVSGVAMNIVANTADLAVAVELLNYPWSEYKVPVIKADVEIEGLYSAGLGLRRLASRFMRPSLGGKNTYPVNAMKQVISKGRVSQDWFDFLSARGYITTQGYSLLFSPPCSLVSIRNLDLSDRVLIGLLQDFMILHGDN